MEYLVICFVAALVSMTTLFSGFGLGTILMPAFALFFPVPVAVAATAVVHLADNIFKVVLVGRNADWKVTAKFAIPGAIAAVAGAMLLGYFSGLPPLVKYTISGTEHTITLVKLVIGVLIIGFSLFELIPGLGNLTFGRKYLVPGGIISGFFGGLSGNQGALRAVFLVNAGLDRDAFIGTSTVSAVIVDISRLIVYGLSIFTLQLGVFSTEIGRLVIAATIAAFLGAFLGSRLMKKVTLRTVQAIVGFMLVLVGTGMATGLL